MATVPEPSRAPESSALLDDRRAADAAAAAPAGAAAAPAARPLPDDALIVLPVRNVVVFPATVLPIGLGRERSQAAVQEAVRLEQPIGVLLQTKPEIDEPGPDELHWVGTSAAVLRYVTAPDGGHHVVARGLRRFRVLQFLDGWPFTVARVQYIDDSDRSDPEIEGARASSRSARSRRCSCCRRCRPRWPLRCRRSTTRRSSPTSSRACSTLRPMRSSHCSRRST
jgi:ATP-dependent Lon protease